MARSNKTLMFITLLLMLISIILGWQLYQKNQLLTNAYVYADQLHKISGVGRMSSQHIHADLHMLNEGVPIGLYTEKNFAPEYGSLDFWSQTHVNKFAHFHEGDNYENVLHVHASGITLGMFLQTLGVNLTSRCLELPAEYGPSLCNDGNKELRVLINGVQVIAPGSYAINDLDRILISYSDGTNLAQEYAQVGKKACLPSQNCPQDA